MAYDIQFTVIIYKKKHYISNIAAIALGDQIQLGGVLLFGNRTLIEISYKDKKLIEKYPVYDLDSMLQSFVEPIKPVTENIVSKKDCFAFDKMLFIPLPKLKTENKYRLRFSLPTVKIFGVYYILCDKQKDVNTRIIVKPE